MGASGEISTDVYTKEMDTHNNLLYSSCHPPHCKEGIPYSQFLWIKRICSEIENYDKNALLIGKHLQRQGYPVETIANSADKARNLNRSDLIRPNNKERVKNDNLFAITTYHPNQKPFQKFWRKIVISWQKQIPLQICTATKSYLA